MDNALEDEETFSIGSYFTKCIFPGRISTICDDQYDSVCRQITLEVRRIIALFLNMHDDVFGAYFFILDQ